MGSMRLETLSLVAAMARRILSTTAEACRACRGAVGMMECWSQCISCGSYGCLFAESPANSRLMGVEPRHVQQKWKGIVHLRL